MTLRPRIFVFGRAVVEVWPHHVRTTVREGQVQAAPHDTPSYRQQAREIGYGDGADAAAAMNRDHDALHIWLADLLGGKSPTLHAIAAGTLDQVPAWIVAGEERMALDFAAYLNGLPPQPSLAPLVMAGYLLEDLRAYWQALQKGKS